MEDGSRGGADVPPEQKATPISRRGGNNMLAFLSLDYFLLDISMSLVLRAQIRMHSQGARAHTKNMGYTPTARLLTLGVG